MDQAAIDAAANRAVAAGSMQVAEPAPVIPGSVLLVDGDGLNYACAGNDGTPPGVARRRLIERIGNLVKHTGAEQVEIHLTEPGSHKRHRYAIATSRPYQGKRHNHKPRNWQFLRAWMEQQEQFVIKRWADREADDGMAFRSGRLHGAPLFLASADKDLRMVPAVHVDMETYQLTDTTADPFDVVGENGLQYGRKWFYMQLLMGDGVDNIPGLPKIKNHKGNFVLCGEATAKKALALASNADQALAIVASHYMDYYSDSFGNELVEQAALLWLSRDREAADLVPPEIAAMFSLETQDLLERIHAAPKAE